MKKSIVALALVAACVTAWALPTTQDVEAAVKQGRYAQAETMLGEVVAAKPGSAKAHYVYAEVLAHNGRFAKAAAEAATAKELDPAIKFTTPEKFRSFEQLLQREQGGTRASTAPATSIAINTAPATAAPAQVQVAPARAVQAAPVSGGIPGWIWIVGLAAVAWFLWRGFNRSRAAAAPAGYGPGQVVAGGMPVPAGGPAGNMPYGANMGGVPQQQSAGGGLLGTGLAVAGGVAGGMMLERMLHPGQSGSANAGNFGNFGSGAAGGDTALDRLGPGGGGLDEAGRELENRSVDFGNGNDWDAGGAADSGGSDGGGSDGGGGWD